jgi:hypothetical protein
MWQWIKSKRVVRVSVAVLVLLYWPARIDTYLTPGGPQEPCTSRLIGGFLEGWLLFLIGVAIGHLFFVFWSAWWKNRTPSFLEAIFWFVLLILPDSYPIYYLLVYRKLDAKGQYAALGKSRQERDGMPR